MSKKTDKDKEKKATEGASIDVVLETYHAQRSNARRDTAVRKGRADVSGGGKKPYRQKGTGRARQGTTRATQWRGGSASFGKQFKNHDVKVNRKVRQAALRAVIADFQANNRIVTELPAMSEPSTKAFAAHLESKGVSGKVLFLYGAGMDANLVKSARNLEYVNSVHMDSIHMQALLGAEWIVMTAEGLSTLTAPKASAKKTGGEAA